MNFKVKSEYGRCRYGEIDTRHGKFETPAFMPVGTAGSVKAIAPDELKSIGAEVVLSNTYHLALRPGHETVKKLGGLHKFMGWEGPILTDSGGYQAMSLAKMSKVSDEGIDFKSHLDGSPFMLSPEKAVEIQMALGTDIAMAFDICPEYTKDKKKVAESVRLTSLWADRCKKSWKVSDGRAMFGIVQGGVFEDLREESASRLLELDFDGYGIGGVSVGESVEEKLQATEFTAALLPEDKPRYLMGIGTPGEIIQAVRLGVDMFDCVLPTRCARTGLFFTSEGKLNIRNSRYKEDSEPPDPNCSCYTCSKFSRAYLRHLHLAREILFSMLATIHNLSFYLGLMKTLREAIKDGTYNEVTKSILENMGKKQENTVDQIEEAKCFLKRA